MKLGKNRVFAFHAVLFSSLFIIAGCGGGGSNSATSAPISPPSPSPTSPSPTLHNVWTWVAGSKSANQAGSYGTLGTSSAGNFPGGRWGSLTWTDASGNFWLFGGITTPSSSSDSYFNDLWKYGNGVWTWMGGSKTYNQAGSYGTLGIAASGNVPGARCNAITWKDSAGNFWLFGGLGIDAFGNSEYLNDVWTYSVTNGQWKWMGGSKNAFGGVPGIYGAMGVSSAANIPGGRSDAVGWTDSVGNFWLFGGLGWDSAGTVGSLNDLWRYDGSQWTWVSGSDLVNQPGNYGTEGTAAPSNMPRSRLDAAAWIDGAGNLWLFGGSYNQPMGTMHLLNDLWKFSGGEWTWMGGSNLPDGPAVYGTEGVASSANVPGARSASVTWSDANGDFWLFGGGGFGGSNGPCWPNDLWKFKDGEWTWMGGSNATGCSGVYGTEGVAALANSPGARTWGVGWADASGNLWLFGGDGYDSTGALGYLNDLWEYQP